MPGRKTSRCVTYRCNICTYEKEFVLLTEGKPLQGILHSPNCKGRIFIKKRDT